MSTNASISKLASEAFARGDYERAHQLYSELSATMGDNLVKANLAICERRLRTGVDSKLEAPETSLETQLEETQRLLEVYYRRCQVLEQQLDQLRPDAP